MGDFIKKQFATFKNYVVNSLNAASIGRWFISSIFLFVAILLLLLALAKGIDASFVSAVMDSIMAGTAILAVLAAKNYLAQFTAQEGYKIAIELVNENIIPITKHAGVIDDYKKLYNKIQELNGQEVDRVMPNELLAFSEALNKSCIELDRLYQSMIDKKHKLATYGIDVSKSYALFYIEITNNVLMIIGECNSLRNNTDVVIDSILSLNRGSYKLPTRFTLDLSNCVFEHPIPEVEKVMGYWSRLIKNHNLFINDGRSVTELFKVKR